MGDRSSLPVLFSRHRLAVLSPTSVVNRFGSSDFLLFFLALGGLLGVCVLCPWIGFTRTSMLSSLVSVGDCSSSSMSYIVSRSGCCLVAMSIMSVCDDASGGRHHQ